LDVGWVPDLEKGSQTMQEESDSRSTRADAKDTENDIGNVSSPAQGEFFKTLQEMSREWMACTTAEVESGLKLSKNLIAAHSVPDAISAYGEWLSGEMDARAEDARRLMSNGQKFMDSGSRLFASGWTSPGAST
jgi:hypothetical protein